MRLRFWLGLVAVFLVAAGSVAAALAVRANDFDNFHRVQHEEAARAAHQAEAVANLSVGQLASAVAFYQSTGQISPHEFDLIAAPLLNRGALTGTAFVQRVLGPERSRFERERGFLIFERGPDGRPRQASDHSVYFPVVHAAAAENEGGASPPLGYDIGSDALRSPALHRAGDTGMAAATPVVPLLTGGSGINVYRPIYRDRAPTGTVAERRKALIGFAAGAFQVSDLTAVATAAVPSAVDVQLREEGRVVAGPEGDLDDPAGAAIQVADRTWLLVIHDPNRPDVSLPLLIAVFGVALAALLGALVVIWSRNERMQELQRLADHDSLTGLKNRRRFEEDLHTEIARADREGSPVALLLLDLDDLKEANDSLGHSAGDRMIIEVARVLGSRMRETDVLARIGGDEFAVALPRCNSAEAIVVAEAIAGAIRDHTWGGGEQHATASIGVTVFTSKSGTTLDELLSQADTALYEVKRTGRDGVRAFSPAGDADPEPAGPSARTPHD